MFGDMRLSSCFFTSELDHSLLPLNENTWAPLMCGTEANCSHMVSVSGTICREPALKRLSGTVHSL